MPGRPELRLLTGPTAAGKTDAALAWAESTGGEILSCDSVCVYRGLDIGSAKPTPAERARVPHHGLDLADPAERFSVEAYVRHARAAIDGCLGRGKPLMVVGGSGFYLAAFFGPVTDDLEIPEDLREQVRGLQREGLPALRARLAELEGGGLPAWLDTDNPIRLAKALERRLASGRPLDELRAAFLARPGPFADLTLRSEVIDRPDPELRARIQSRTRAMLAGGLVEEARALAARNLPGDLPAVRAVGYREVLAWLSAGEPTDLPTLAHAIDQATWSLVTSQRKWFRRLGLTPSAS
jgi:tRNA dimethylallyltransferase